MRFAPLAALAALRQKFRSAVRHTLLLTATATLACTGCTIAGKSTSQVHADAPDAVLATNYSAFGDSITYGYSLPDPDTQKYVALLAASHNLALTDYALGGDQACDIPTRQIFPNTASPDFGDNTLYSVLISTNDINYKGAGAYESVFNLCHQATLAWLATPLTWKILGNDPDIVTTGPTHIDTGNNWNSMITDGLGATISINFNRTNEGALYIWYRIGDSNPGTASYALDGNTLGTFSTATPTAIKTLNGTDNSMALLRIPNVAPGYHNLTFTQTSDGSSAIGIIAIGTPGLRPALVHGKPGPSAGPTPRILVGTTPLQYTGNANAPCPTADSPVCAAYIADIQQNIALLAGDGLDIELFDTRKYMTGDSSDMSDAFHPNPVGHQEVFRALNDIY